MLWHLSLTLKTLWHKKHGKIGSRLKNTKVNIWNVCFCELKRSTSAVFPCRCSYPLRHLHYSNLKLNIFGHIVWTCRCVSHIRAQRCQIICRPVFKRSTFTHSECHLSCTFSHRSYSLWFSTSVHVTQSHNLSEVITANLTWLIGWAAVPGTPSYL